MSVQSKTKPLTIGEVSRRSGVGVETVRFYERQGLIEDPPRKASGYRQYSDEVVTRLQFIRRAKELGFSLGEIEELFALRVDPAAHCAEVQQRALEKVEEIDRRIADLGRIKAALLDLSRACGEGASSDCPILEALERQDWN